MASTTKVAALLVTLMVLLSQQDVAAECGYKSCPVSKANMINVHLVAHSHDDVGWLKTVDQYYYGNRNSIQRAGVQYILDNVVRELMKDSNRRFVYVESAFFFKWYDEQTEDMKRSVEELIANGNLEFAGGAWSMNDEAAVHYQSVIDQFTLGLSALSKTFGTCGRPRIGWQIDPFGHSREMASMFAQMGYDGVFFARMDWVEKSARVNDVALEMIWHGSENLGERADLFTGMLYNHYSAPPGFCFDTLCSDAPIIDGESYDNNVDERVDAFIEYIERVSNYYRTTEMLTPMGDDFNYQNADMNFKNMDKLIKYVNQRQASGSKVNVFYSTPGCYLNAVHQHNATWPTKTQDFFPYASDWHTYWTGYYTSRPTQKRFERDGNHFLQVVKQLTTFAQLEGEEVTHDLDKLRHAMGVMQHHDAITGTEKQHVAYDYDRMLAAALDSAQNNARLALRKLSNLTNGEFASCLQLNISVCEFVSEGINDVVVTLFNPLAQPSTQYVRVPVRDELVEVTDEDGHIVPSEIVPLPQEILDLSFRDTNTKYELVFSAHVRKLAHFYIKSQPQHLLRQKLLHRSNRQYETTGSSLRAVSGNIVIENSLVKLAFDATGHLSEIEMNGVTQSVRQEFYYYNGAAGNNAEYKNRSSGAYIFRPDGAELKIGQQVLLSLYEGKQVKEVHQRFNDWVSQVIRIYEGVNRVEFEWLVGPIPVDDEIGKEVITRFTTDLKTNGVFYTDSNGREMLRRVRNQREYFQPNLTEAVSANYYPITARLVMEDERTRIALLNDRAQGGTSIKDGVLELMLHRRLLRDDAFGVGEALNEPGFGNGLIARGKVYLIMSGEPRRWSPYERIEQQKVHLPFWKFFSSKSTATGNVPAPIPDLTPLPTPVQLLSLEPYSEKQHLLRLENFMDRNETLPVNFNIRHIFDALSGQEIYETTLDGSMKLEEMRRFKFQPLLSTVDEVEYIGPQHTPLIATKNDPASKFDITLDPMQIRTFIITWE